MESPPGLRGLGLWLDDGEDVDLGTGRADSRLGSLGQFNAGVGAFPHHALSTEGRLVAGPAERAAFACQALASRHAWTIARDRQPRSGFSSWYGVRRRFRGPAFDRMPCQPGT